MNSNLSLTDDPWQSTLRLTGKSTHLSRAGGSEPQPEFIGQN
jgi:hypothetical protein